MDFTDTQEDTLFRVQLRTWLESAVPSLGPSPSDLEDKLRWWQNWQTQLYAAGYAGISWPEKYQGRGATIIQQAIFAEECDRAGAPERLNILGEGLVGPTLIDFGTDEQKQRFLSTILTGQEVWCQLFSEPNAGSDLASLQTKAVRDGDGWRINGQKVWTTRAQIASYGILLARTTAGTRGDGITYFIVDMKAEGVQVKPLVHMLGESEFSEVFFDDVWISDGLVIGEVDKGWGVAMVTLGYERVALATGRVNTRQVMDEIVALVNNRKTVDGLPLAGDPVVRQRLAELYARTALHQLTGKRILSNMTFNGKPGPEASTAKLFSTSLVEEMADFALSIIGLAGQEEPGEAKESGRWLRLANQARGTSIAGGSTFIQRNIVAERVLGLPRK